MVAAAAGTTPVFGARAAALTAPLLLVLLLVALPPGTGAAAQASEPIPRDDPETMLRIATDRLLAISREARSYAESDRER